MPEFFAEHVPSDLDEFTTGYLECAEWLAQADNGGTGELTDAQRDTCRGFTRKAIAAAKRDCKAFQRDHAALLAQYEESTERDMSSAGHDFWLTRNRHGAGFWDRGDQPCLSALTDAAHGYGEENCEYYRGYLHLS